MKKQTTTPVAVNTLAKIEADATGVITIPWSLCGELRAAHSFPRQRNFAEKREFAIREPLITGKWMGRASRITLAFTEGGGEAWIINGHTRLKVAYEAEFDLPTQVEFIKVADLAEATALYSLCDSSDASRTVSQRLKASDSAADLSEPTRKAIFNAMPALSLNLYPVVAPGKRTQHDLRAFDSGSRLESLGEWAAEAKIYEQLIAEHASKADVNRLRRAPLFAVGLYTLRHNPERAQAFWAMFMARSAMHKGSPTATLYDYDIGRLSHRLRIQSTCIPACVAWNAHFNGKALHNIAVQQGDRPFLLGTPLTREVAYANQIAAKAAFNDVPAAAVTAADEVTWLTASQRAIQAAKTFPERGDTQKAMAIFGVSETYVKKAKALLRDDPDLAQSVLEGRTPFYVAETMAQETRSSARKRKLAAV